LFKIEPENNNLMSVRIFRAIIVGLVLFSIASCQRNSDKSLTGFFDKVSEDIPAQKVKKFKKSEIDSAGNNVELIYEEMWTAYNKYGSKYDLGIFSNSIERDSTRLQYLTVAYHLYCNNKEVSIESVKAEIKKMSDYEDFKYYVECAKKDDELANINSSNFNMGDTISVCLLIDNDMSVEYRHYYCAAIFTDEEYSNRNSTNLSGVLISKSQGERNATGRDLIFNVKVLEIGRDDVIMSWNNITEIGDTVKLDVTSYRRLINRGMSAKCSEP
jgi:hypothetical protein